MFSHTWSQRGWNNSVAANHISQTFRSNLPLLRRIFTVVTEFPTSTQWTEQPSNRLTVLRSLRSIEHVLQLLQFKTGHRPARRDYRFILLLRFDTFFRTRFDLSILNPALFYTASRCAAPASGKKNSNEIIYSFSGDSQQQGQQVFPPRYCAALQSLLKEQPTSNPSLGFSDFSVSALYFAARPTLIRLVFLELTGDILSSSEGLGRASKDIGEAIGWKLER